MPIKIQIHWIRWIRWIRRIRWINQIRVRIRRIRVLKTTIIFPLRFLWIIWTVILSFSKQIFLLKHVRFNLINKIWQSRFCVNLHGNMLSVVPKNWKDWNCCHIMGSSFARWHLVKVNLIEVNLAVVNIVGITTLKKISDIAKILLNLLHVETTINFLKKWKL